ncbi:FadR/GntR family transcriptional regulator [Cohaesibacter celericrescens]|uniref:Pyruvate dehydrogenase complex repressor n=1 Tax=Cohaesibacter celericrescens TaxID=2067669 RepID=A0A2N5XXK6_9HYPH|nr:FadR/GntR family transcriptional regulator [Cohaesibacter celericrescens]PLW79222.1 GntR family transcriptional regulator [Cohaesibacter celericrescens]
MANNSVDLIAANGKGKGRSSLSERVYNLLHTRISNGDYKENQKLPTEAVMVDEFGVSRPVLRGALDRLREEGLIYSRQGAGSFVKVQNNKALGFSKVETIADIQRCYEFRLSLEPDAAYYASLRRNDASIAEIDAALHLLEQATTHLTHKEDADYAFHIAIAKACNNHYFEASMGALREHIHAGMKMHGQSLMDDAVFNLEFVFKEHVGIHTAIKDRNAELARQLMREHIEHSRDRLFGGSLLDLSL